MMTRYPYPGLRPFTREKADLFFGRDAQILQLVDRLAMSRFIAVTGLSGCGKSSLVRAGLIPALENGLMLNTSFHWKTVTMRPGNAPIRNLAEALLHRGVLWKESAPMTEETITRRIPFLEASLCRGPLGLITLFHETPLPEQTNLLILIDQFEELFQYHHHGGRDESEARDEAEAFVALLLASVVQKEIPIYLVVTMRSESIGECALFHHLPEFINNGLFLTPRLTRSQLQEAIVEPAKQFQAVIEPRLVTTMLNEMGTDPDQLPVLQHCLMRMWLQKTYQKDSGFTILLADYHKIGGLKKALSNHADETYKGLNDERKQKIVELMFRFITERTPDRQDRRRPMPLQDIVDVTKASLEKASLEEVKEVIEIFRHPDRCFLFPPVDNQLKKDSMIDISHESLIRQWRRLNDWVVQEFDSAETFKELEKTYRRRSEESKRSEKPTIDLLSNDDCAYFLRWWEKEKPTAEWAKRYITTPKTDKFDPVRFFKEVKKFLDGSFENFQANKTLPEKIKDARRAKYFVFTPATGWKTSFDGWVMLFGKNEYWAANIPPGLKNTLKEYNNSGKEIKQVAITPDQEWIILTGKNGFVVSSRFPAQITKILYDLNRTGKEIKQVALAPNSEWVILSESQGYWSNNLPPNLKATLHNYYQQGKRVEHVAFATKQGVEHVAFASNQGWVIIYDSYSFCSSNLPQGLIDKLTEYHKTETPIKVVAISPGQNWIVIAE